jgi:aminoglycoside/choline kinase family phosphotransferase
LESTDSVVDLRQQQLEQWLAEQLGAQLEGVAAGSDAGFRRYFRYHWQGRSLIAMDAPPEHEDCRPFIEVAAMLAKAGILVPEIIAEDVGRGFLLLSDLGLQTYLEAMNAPDFDLAQADHLFNEATDALVKFQLSSQPGVLAEYDETLLRRELELFPEWYLQRHLGLTIDTDLRQKLDELFEQLISQVLSQAQVYVHRDFMPRNLMINRVDDRGVGVLDFQDAVYGPVSYDAACLFKDAFISWPDQKVNQWLSAYWQQAHKAGVPVPDAFSDFQRDCDFMGAQRHLKVIGIFARICHRDGKSRYLDDVPRFMDYLSSVAKRRPQLSGLTELLQYLSEQTIATS